MTKEEREILKEQLAELNKAMAEIDKAKAPFEKAGSALCRIREQLLDRHETDIVATCESCLGPIFEGELAYTDGGDGPTVCEEHAPTWGELLSQAREMDTDCWEERDGKEKFIAKAESMPPDEKNVWEH